MSNVTEELWNVSAIKLTGESITRVGLTDGTHNDFQIWPCLLTIPLSTSNISIINNGLQYDLYRDGDNVRTNTVYYVFRLTNKTGKKINGTLNLYGWTDYEICTKSSEGTDVLMTFVGDSDVSFDFTYWAPDTQLTLIVHHPNNVCVNPSWDGTAYTTRENFENVAISGSAVEA